MVGDDQYDVIGVAANDVEDIELHEDDIAAFRHPMAPGEVRQNILFQDSGDWSNKTRRLSYFVLIL